MNLLPLVEKKIIREEYYKRLISVSLVLVFVLLLTFVIPVAAFHIASTYEIGAKQTELGLLNKDNVNRGVVADVKTAKDVNDKLVVLDRVFGEDSGYDPSSILSSIIAVSNVRLASMSYDHVAIKKDQIKEVGYRIILSGVASDRVSLQKFVRNLESNEMFASVDLPVSNLIENRNLQFNITVMVKKK